MEIVNVKVEDLKQASYNPRRWSEKATADLAESIRRFGMVDPIIVNSAVERKNIVIGGHFRLMVAKGLGYKEVPVAYIDIPDIEKERELNLRLNRNTGEWDLDLLKEFEETVLTNIGFEKEELDHIFGLEVADDFDIEKEKEKILKDGKERVREGDLWELGGHRLAIGDCTNSENWERLFGSGRFDLMLTDPPYRLSYVRKRKTVKKGGGFGYKQARKYLGLEEKGDVPQFDAWLSIADKYQNPNGENVMIFESWINTVELWQAIERYWKIRNMVIWWAKGRSQGFSRKYGFFNKYDIAPMADKGNAVLNEDYEEEASIYFENHAQKLLETYDILLYGQKGKSYIDKGEKGSRWAKVTDHMSYPVSNAKSTGQSLIFGTKPIQILVPYIKILSPRNGTVVEPFAGSGSTIIASEIMKRKCMAVEAVPLYGEVILARWERFTGLEARKIATAR